MDLYENLKESYKPANQAKQNIAGYQLDNELSDINHKVYFNKDKDRTTTTTRFSTITSYQEILES